MRIWVSFGSYDRRAEGLALVMESAYVMKVASQSCIR